MNIHELLAEPVDMEKLSQWLDGLDNASRIAAATSISAAEQARLWEAAKGFGKIDLEHFAPSSDKPLTEVIHHGRNSLPMFTSFQKRFCLPDREGEFDQRWGYNHQALAFATGPGFFVCREATENEEDVVIDYWLIPPGKPAAWPAIKPNSRGLSRLVYFQMRDYMRGVSKHVSIGRAMKGGKWMNNWFVLCREG